MSNPKKGKKKHMLFTLYMTGDMIEDFYVPYKEWNITDRRLRNEETSWFPYGNRVFNKKHIISFRYTEAWL